MSGTARANNVSVAMQMYNITGQHDLAALCGFTQPAVRKWLTGEAKPNVILADLLGLSYDWLVGRSPEPWGHDMIELRRRVRQHIVANADLRRPSSPSTRFHVITSFILNDESFVTKRVLSLYLGIDEETLDRILAREIHVEWAVTSRLAEYIDIPSPWFEDGAVRHVKDANYETLLAKLAEWRLNEEDAIRVLEQAYRVRSGSFGF